MTLKEQFEEAVKSSKQLPAKPDNETLLKLYGLYKQSTEGNLTADAPEPGAFDFVGKAKRAAWQELTGLSTDEAMNEYITLVKSLQPAHPL